MAEIAGLAFSATAVGTLLKQCLAGYHFIRNIKDQDHDVKILRYMLTYENNRLIVWGLQLGIARYIRQTERSTSTDTVEEIRRRFEARSEESADSPLAQQLDESGSLDGQGEPTEELRNSSE